MALSLLTNAFLDVTTGVIWWTIKKTSYGIYYGTKYVIYGSTEENEEENNNEILMEEIRNLKEEILDLKNNFKNENDSNENESHDNNSNNSNENNDDLNNNSNK
jgi:hypothetical protein